MMEDKVQSECLALEGNNSTTNKMPETGNSNKRKLKTALEKDADTENGSLKRHVIQKPTRSVFPVHEDLPPQEFAFSIDHILEEILTSLDKSSLLQCRLVCHRWRLVSNTVLKQTDVPISFTYNKSYKSHIISLAVPGRSELPEPLDQSRLQDLTQFLKKSYAPTGPFTLDTFPCNKIVIRGGTVFNAQVQSFLDTYGKYVRNLYVDCSGEAPYTRYFHLVKMLDHILCVQVPNLEFFSFLMNCGDRWADLAKKDIRGDQNQGPRNTRLHTLTTGSIPRSVLESIIENCPSLKQINVDFKDMHLLMEPINRMHLLREFRIEDPHDYERSYDMLGKVEAAISSMQPGNLPVKFTSMYINFDRIDLGWNWAEKRNCLVRVINKILEGSWDTLESITFKNYFADYAIKGIIWPPVLPKVRDLTLCPRDSCGLEIFPFDGTFKIQQAFPRLRDVTYKMSFCNIRCWSFAGFSNKTNLGPVLSVVHVEVNILLKQQSSDDVEAAERLQVRDHYSYILNKLYPRAELSLNFQHRQM